MKGVKGSQKCPNSTMIFSRHAVYGPAGVIDAAMAMESTVRDELSYAPEKLEEAEAQVRQEDAAAQPAEPEQAQPEQMEEPAAEYWVQCESCKKCATPVDIPLLLSVAWLLKDVIINNYCMNGHINAHAIASSAGK